MLSSKQPYGIDSVPVPIYRWSPALSEDSEAPQITAREAGEVGRVGIHLYHLPPGWATARGGLAGFSCALPALPEPGSPGKCLCPT